MAHRVMMPPSTGPIRVGTLLPMASAVPEGSFVVSFAMSREEEIDKADAARSKLRELLACCAKESPEWTLVRPKPPVTESLAGTAAVTASATNSIRKLTKSLSLGSSELLRRQQQSSLATHPPSVGRTRVWERKQRFNFDQLFEARSCTRIKANHVEDIVQVIDACSTSANCHRSLMRIVYGKCLADTRTLLEKRLSDNETLCVRWTALRRTHAMVNDTDFCLCEYTWVQTSPDDLQEGQPVSNHNNQEEPQEDSFTDLETYALSRMSGRLYNAKRMPIAYQVVSSIETKYCPLLEQSHRLLRAHCPLSGFLIFEADTANEFDIVFYSSVRIPNDTSPMQRKNVQRQISRLAKSVGKFKDAMATLDMSHALSQRSLIWVDDDARKTCALCLQRFMLLRRHRHHCRLCGEVVCRDCCGLLDALLPTVGITKLRICLRCQNASIQHQRPEKKDKVTDTKVTTTSTNGAMTTRNMAVKAPRGSCSRRHQRTDALSSSSSSTPLCSSSSSASSALLQELKKPFPSILPDAERRKPLTLRLESPTLPSTIVSCPKTTGSSTTSSFNKAFSFHFRRGGAGSISQDDSRDVLTRSASRVESSQPNSCSKIDFGLKKLQMNERFRSFARAKASNQQDVDVEPLSSIKPAVIKKRRLSLTRIERCHDQLLVLCQQTHELFNCAFAAVTVFVKPSSTSSTSSKESARLKSFLKPAASSKLLNISNNLMCCEPVLDFKASLCVLNLVEEPNSEVNKLEMRHLPIVAGPQRAKFYVGAPLLDSRHRMIGAIAAFDARVGDENDRMKVERLEALVDLHMASMESHWGGETMRSRVRKAVHRIQSMHNDFMNRTDDEADNDRQNPERDEEDEEEEEDTVEDKLEESFRHFESTEEKEDEEQEEATRREQRRRQGRNRDPVARRRVAFPDLPSTEILT